MSSLLSMIDTEKIITEICQSAPNTKLIYIFGSLATGETTLESDIDIAFLSQTNLGELEKWNLAEKLASFLKRDVDLIDLKKASTVLAVQVISKGKCIYYFDQNTKGYYEMYTLSFYAKLNEERAEILKDFYTS